MTFIFDTPQMQYKICIFEQQLGVLYEVRDKALCRDHVCVSDWILHGIFHESSLQKAAEQAWVFMKTHACSTAFCKELSSKIPWTDQSLTQTWSLQKAFFFTSLSPNSCSNIKKKKNSVALVRERTIPTAAAAGRRS